MRASRQQSELVRLYASERGWSIRTAQNHRKNNDPRWAEWYGNRLARQVIAAPEKERTQAAVEAAKAAAAVDSAEYDLEEERMEAAALKNANNIQSLLDVATAAGDTVEIASLTKSHETALKVWQLTKKSAESARLASGKMLMVEQLDDFRKSLQALKSVLYKMPAELGGKANPMDRQFGIAACTEWLNTRFNDHFQAAEAEIQRLA